MLGAGFLHMLVDASDDLATMEEFGSTTYLPHLLCVGGILIPFALEKGGLLCCSPAEDDSMRDVDPVRCGWRAGALAVCATSHTDDCAAAQLHHPDGRHRSNSVAHSIGLDSRSQMHTSLAAMKRRLRRTESDYGAVEGMFVLMLAAVRRRNS